MYTKSGGPRTRSGRYPRAGTDGRSAGTVALRVLGHVTGPLTVSLRGQDGGTCGGTRREREEQDLRATEVRDAVKGLVRLAGRAGSERNAGRSRALPGGQGLSRR